MSFGRELTGSSERLTDGLVVICIVECKITSNPEETQ